MKQNACVKITDELKSTGVLTGTEDRANTLIESFNRDLDALAHINKDKQKSDFFSTSFGQHLFELFQWVAGLTKC